MTWWYWTHASVWLAGGMIIGYILRDLREAVSARIGVRTMANVSPAPPPPSSPKQRRRHNPNLHMQIIGVAILIAVVVSILLSYNASNNELRQANDLHVLSACQTRINEQFLTAIKGRAALSEKDRHALTTLIGGIPGVRTPEGFRLLLDDYNQTEHQIDLERPKLPPLPSQVCR